MLRFSRPLYQAIRSSTGLTGLAVHPNPIPALTNTYENTLTHLARIPETSAYRQATEALIQNKLNIVKAADADIAAVEKGLGEGMIEESLLIAVDELKLAAQMVDWKAWEPLAEKPAPGQWEYVSYVMIGPKVWKTTTWLERAAT
ncbi:NADH dehydrogenase 1 alpha subcomplex subunit 5 [Mycena indigotica]|uniref:NADH dehydrogenase 1 alpha subcomplex subunit 5 n=1 Tax=Mycena indigotica TaxID=2126181 RepID=A0A8H6SW17_9AGAR|nr:NADH dehydrogenase 1 alpha subcomplex subunit 5 [Mycena indigotica]KAF7306958.1 NADH dehydrogenase 1 alpha subcomplex subunit 5 [Mycena indigotica]